MSDGFHLFVKENAFPGILYVIIMTYFSLAYLPLRLTGF